MGLQDQERSRTCEKKFTKESSGGSPVGTMGLQDQERT
jgi:hypothetical protein